MTRRIEENVSLDALTTLGIGGPARFFVRAASEDDVRTAIGFARHRGVPVAVLGGGSNLLVADEGFPGLALQVLITGVQERDSGDGVRVLAGAGEDWDPFVARCVAGDLYGIENLSGIPGWVGGTPVQNVGAYGQEVSSVIASVRVYDRQSEGVTDLPVAACGFGYRESLFNTSGRGRYVVLAVEYELRRAGRPLLEYPDLARFFAGRSREPSLREVRTAVREIRATKAMLRVEGDPDARSAGSFFKNPVVGANQLAEVEAAGRRNLRMTPGETMPGFPAGPGRTKLSAAWLIERAGFSRGLTKGPVGLSRKHALALVNRGGARARDVLDLAEEIQAGVESCFGIRLAPEPVFLGFPLSVLSRFGAVPA